MKCGTPEQNTEMFNFTIKLVAHNGGYDDGEVKTNNQVSDSIRKKRKIMEDLKDIAEKRSADIKELSATIKQTISSLSETTKTLRIMRKIRSLNV